MIGMYVLLDGYDLGVGVISPFVARSDAERAAAMHGIGPFWNGNEVWLIASGGVLFALFPAAYAASFSIFYLPFTVVLWLLIFRGMSLELREHYTGEIWHGFWDAAFFLSSALLIVLFGVALGNLVRGLPLGARGYFLGTFAFLLNPYALGTGILALFSLALHGATFSMMRTQGVLSDNCRRFAKSLRVWVAIAYVAVTVATVVAHVHCGRVDRSRAGVLAGRSRRAPDWNHARQRNACVMEYSSSDASQAG
jgi:cytochrome d ubiquinol oxidase subunit II